MAKFELTTISDQKRLVRGEHYLMARRLLRCRDRVHHAKWRVLIMAGGAPHGEVACIREIMPKAHITAVDKDQECLEAAIDAGCDEVIHCDLSQWTVEGVKKYPARPLREVERFDVVNIDLCSGANDTTKTIGSVYRQLVAESGVFMMTFSYGRDLAEIFTEALNKAKKGGDHSAVAKVAEVAGSDLVLGRLCFMFSPSRIEQIRSVMLYRGAEMPMISVLSHPKQAPLSVVKCEPGDFEIAVTCPDPGRMYDCPQDRIEALRRKHAAIKAAHTTRERKLTAEKSSYEVCGDMSHG